MNKVRIHPSAKYFEELELGKCYISPARTITEADIVNFCGISGDFNPLHSNSTFASTTIFGKRISHGLLILSIATGAMSRVGFIEGTVEAFLGLNWRFIGPVKIGDTIYTEFKVKDKREVKKRPNHGLLTLEVTMKNQDEEVIQQGEWHLLVRKRVRE